MSDLEAVFWRAEVDPRLRSGGVVLDLLDCVPDWDRLVAAHEWAVRQVPRLREKVVDDPLRIGPPMWVVTEIDLNYHLTRVRLTDSPGALLDLVSAFHMEPLDPCRPLWRAVLVEGVGEGEAAYLLKIHHSMTDGTAAVQLFDLLHARTRAGQGARTLTALGPAATFGTHDVAVSRVRGLLSTAPVSLARALVAAGRALGQAVSHPDQVTSYAASALRVGGGSGATPSPQLAGRGLSRRVRMLEVPLDELKAAGKAAGGTLNDAFLAGLLGGLGRYHDKHGVRVGDLPIALPVNLRGASNALGGNQFAAASVAGPAGEPDPAQRIRLVNARVRAARGEAALDLMGTFAPVASRLPGPLLALAARRMSSSLDLQASNIAGLDRDAFLAGARITRMHVLGPVPGSAIMATLLSHQGICCIGITTDNDAVPDPDVLLECFQEGLAEVLALGSVPS